MTKEDVIQRMIDSIILGKTLYLVSWEHGKITGILDDRSTDARENALFMWSPGRLIDHSHKLDLGQATALVEKHWERRR